MSYIAQLFDSLLARIMNCELGRVCCALWDNKPVNLRRIESEEDLLDTLANVATNPVQDGLVRCGKDWPAVRTRPELLGTSRPISRPNIRFFTKRTKMAADYTLNIEVPPVLEHWDFGELRAELERRIVAKEKAARADMKAAGRTF